MTEDRFSSQTRRQFVKRSSLAAAGATIVSGFPNVITGHAAPDDPIRVGVIGCGGRGTGAALNVLQAATRVVYPSKGFHTEDAAYNARAAAKNVKVVALADLFKDRLEHCRNQLVKVENSIPDDHCFVGFDAYRKLLALPDVNYVILAAPPLFHPPHLRAAVEAGKHVFMEKPAAVDGPGVRSVIESGEIARKRGLGIVSGTQRRHQPGYVETIKRLRDGAIGELVECRAYWNGGSIWVIAREAGWKDSEWQLRNWNYFYWLSGDHIVEQHLHNLDIMNWAIGDHPIKASSLGGRQARTDPIFGNVYDHFATEFEYASGLHMFSQCRQINDCTNNVSEAVLGTKGFSNCSDLIRAGQEWRYNGPKPNPYEQEHIDLIQSIRNGTPLNEARATAESTLMGIMGRVSAYTGKSVTWDQVLNSSQDLMPAELAFGPMPVAEVAIPGKYKFE
jgi:predicted dehydrogenase